MTLMHHKKYVKLAPNDYEVWSEWTLDYKQYEYPNDYEKVKKLIIDNLEEKLVPEKFRELNKQNKLFGHCYHATQALYYFFVDAKLKIMSASCEGPAEHHWWLQDALPYQLLCKNQVRSAYTMESLNVVVYRF